MYARTKTQEAIIELLSYHKEFLDGESIFLKLNADEKHYSYAAVYNAIRVLHEVGVIQSETQAAGRKKCYTMARTSEKQNYL